MPDQSQSSEDPPSRTKEPLPQSVAGLKPDGHDASLGQAARYAGFGLQFVISLLLFLYAGRWVDGKLGTAPFFLVLGVFVGAGAAFFSMYRTLVRWQREEDEALRRKRAGREGA